MQFKSALTKNPERREAVAELAREVGGMQPDLLMVFATHDYGPDFDDVISALQDAIGPRNLVGCTGEGVIGANQEIERSSAISVLAAKLPGVRTLPFMIDQNDVTTYDEPGQWHEHLGLSPKDKPSFVVLPEPFSIHAERCLGQLDEAFPGATIVGGMASGANAPGQNRLFLNDQVLRQGMVGVSLSGPINIHTVVSQGCRPVGESYVITKADENVIFELRGKPALDVLRGVYQEASSGDQSLMQQGVHVGRLVDERRREGEASEYLIRNVAGVVKDTALAVTTLVRPGQTIQFHVRDSATATEEMRKLLNMKMTDLGQPLGGLLFSCNGRGTRLFGAPNHDIAMVNDAAKGCAVSGFFAAGEIGPIGNRTFIHGLTSSLVLFQKQAG